MIFRPQHYFWNNLPSSVILPSPASASGATGCCKRGADGKNSAEEQSSDIPNYFNIFRIFGKIHFDRTYSCSASQLELWVQLLPHCQKTRPTVSGSTAPRCSLQQPRSQMVHKLHGTERMSQELPDKTLPLAPDSERATTRTPELGAFTGLDNTWATSRAR